MKWTLNFGNLIMTALICAVTSTQELQEFKDTNIFVRNFRTLHNEAPSFSLNTRANRDNTKFLSITQKLDNFNESDRRSFEMRYISNNEFYQEGGPLFIFVGGEWEITTTYMTGGHFYDMAKEHNAHLFYTEHRYYGRSRPTSNMDKANIKYLSVLQALADLAHFIEEMHATIPGAFKSKVIIAGRSYSATMVTWFKKLYPHLASGAWASSAPLHAKADFIEYKEITGESIRLIAGEKCYKRIENGIAGMEAMFANKRGAEVKAMLKLCDAFNEYNDLDLWTLFSEISDIFAGLVQTHSVGQIEGACEEIMKGRDDISGLSTYVLRKFGKTSCNDLSYKASISTLLNTAFTDNMMRQWTYQTCNEFGWYQTSGSEKQPFGTKFPLTLYTQMCSDVYGDKFTNTFINEQINATNKRFGGLNPNVENVYFSHGELDPWRAMGTTDEATIIPLHAHCKDFDSISSKDTPALRDSKEKIANLVRKWLGTDNVVKETN